jgi:hypothetical protein
VPTGHSWLRSSRPARPAKAILFAVVSEHLAGEPSTCLRRYEDFPRPVVDLPKSRVRLWLRQDIKTWREWTHLRNRLRRQQLTDMELHPAAPIGTSETLLFAMTANRPLTHLVRILPRTAHLPLPKEEPSPIECARPGGAQIEASLARQHGAWC